MAEEVTEIPLSFSISIQSDTACLAALRPLTVPARLMAPPYSRNFSVSVVFPASGWDMIANVLRFFISSVIWLSICDKLFVLRFPLSKRWTYFGSTPKIIQFLFYYDWKHKSRPLAFDFPSVFGSVFSSARQPPFYGNLCKLPLPAGMIL